MFIGNNKAVKLLKKSMETGRFSQAYLFSGPENVGKFTLAKIFAQSLIREKSLDIDIKEKKDPLDVIVISPEVEEKKGIKREKDIKIENIRNAQRELSLFPYEGKFKVLIIDDAHRMTVSSQNALLKILEEPNKTSIIILVAQDESKIIPTIKSRCQRINFSLAERKKIEELFKGIADKESLTIFSMGRPGLALRILENKEELDIKRLDLTEFNGFASFGTNKRLKLAEKMSNDVAVAARKLEFWIWLIRLEIMKKNNYSGFFSFKTIEKIEESLAAIKNTNANARLVIENLFLEI